MPKRLFAYLLLVLATLCWGVAFVVIKVGTAHFDPFLFLAWRYGLAAAALAGVFPRLLRRLPKGTLRQGLILSLPLTAGTVIQTLGLGQTSASNTAFITGMTLVFLPLLKFVLEREALRHLTLVANALALTGLGILTLRWPLQINPGDIWVLVSTLAYALHILWTGHAVRQHEPLALSLVQLAACGLSCALLACLSGVGLQLPPTLAVWQALGFTGLLATAFTYTAQVVAQQHIEDHKVVLVFLLEPVFGCLAAWLFLHEPFSLQILLGGGLILMAIVLAETKHQSYTDQDPAGYFCASDTSPGSDSR